MKTYFLFLALSFVIPLNSCTTTKKMSDNQTREGHFRLYSYPKESVIAEGSKDLKRIVIVSSNNFEGKIWPEHFNIPNKHKEKRVISTGGISAMKAYSDIFKKKFNNEVLFVDSGSSYHPERNYMKTVSLYNYLNPDIMALGTHEFSFKSRSRRYLKKLETITSNLKPQIITSNLFDLTTAKKVKLNNVKETLVKEINGVKVGFISTLSPKRSNAIPARNLLGLYIQNPASNVITKSELLRRAGAQVIVLMTNSSIDCNSILMEKKDLPIDKVNFNPRQKNICKVETNDLYNLISQLPPETIDLVVTSDGVGKTANVIKGIPIIQNSGQGQFYSWIEIYFDPKLSRVDTDKTKIHQPVKLCHQFLKSHEDCYMREEINEQEVVPAYFLGEKIQISPLPTI